MDGFVGPGSKQANYTNHRLLVLCCVLAAVEVNIY
jgi:hypothetical protein